MKGVFGGESMAPCRTIRSWKLSPLQSETRIVCQSCKLYHERAALSRAHRVQTNKLWTHNVLHVQLPVNSSSSMP
jgi:hypothetical protein